MSLFNIKMSLRSNKLSRKQSCSNLQEYYKENEISTNSNVDQPKKSFSMIICNHTKNINPKPNPNPNTNTINKIYGRLITIYHEPNVSDILLNSIMERIGFAHQERYYRIKQ